MDFERTASGRWIVDADWLDEPVAAPTPEEAYWEAKARHSRGR
jgi:hypothetical protein